MNYKKEELYLGRGKKNRLVLKQQLKLILLIAPRITIRYQINHILPRLIRLSIINLPIQSKLCAVGELDSFDGN